MENRDLINLTLSEIGRSVTIMHDFVEHAKETNKSNGFIGVEYDTCEKILEETREKLRDVLANIGHVMDSEELLCKVDEALSEVPLDLIFERKTEEDF